MTFKIDDRTFETTLTTGTGTLALVGAQPGYQTFVAGVGDGNTTYYAITDGTDFEIGIGTVTDASTDTLSRDTVISSTNGDAKVNWGAGSKNVFVGLPLSRITSLVDPAQSSGIVARTAANTYAARTITGSSEISVANGDGVSDNPTISFPMSTVTQAVAEAGVATQRQIWTAQRVKQAIGALSLSLVRSARTSNTILTPSDNSTLIDITSGTFTQTFQAATTLTSGWFIYYRNAGTGVVTLDPNSAELIDGASTLIMYPGDVRLIQCTGSAFNTIRIEAGTIVGGVRSKQQQDTGNGTGSTKTNLRRFTTTRVTTGTAITYADSAADGATWTINEPGYYFMYYSDQVAADSDLTIAISRNVTANTGPTAIATVDRLGIMDTNATGIFVFYISAIEYLEKDDVLRAHITAGVPSVGILASFGIEKITHGS